MKKYFIIAIVSTAVLTILICSYFIAKNLLSGGNMPQNSSTKYGSDETELEIAAQPEEGLQSIMIKAENGEYYDIAGMYQMISEQQQGAAKDDDNYFFSYLALPNTKGIYIEIRPDGKGYQKRFESEKELFAWQYFMSGKEANGILIKFLSGQPDELWRLIEINEGSTYFDIVRIDENDKNYGNSFERTLELKKQNSLLIVTDSNDMWIPLHKESVWSQIQHINEDGSVSTLCGDMAPLTIEERQSMIDSLYAVSSVNEATTYGEIDRAITYTVYRIEGDYINIYGASGENMISHGEELSLPKEEGEYLIAITVVWKFNEDLFCDKYYFKYQPENN
ncbi:MAG: hypothetical protein JXN65_08095 [Clostridia bacterium]|nr:hypothetical protein [Clostridia bacterium]